MWWSFFYKTLWFLVQWYFITIMSDLKCKLRSSLMGAWQMHKRFSFDSQVPLTQRRRAGFFFPVTQLECEGALSWMLYLCVVVNCHCSYCFSLGMSLSWLTSCRNHKCFRKTVSSISLIVIRWLRSSDFPGLQNGKWILHVALSNRWTNSCNPLRQPTISSVRAIEVLGLFIREGNHDNLPEATEHAFAFRFLVSLA